MDYDSIPEHGSSINNDAGVSQQTPHDRPAQPALVTYISILEKRHPPTPDGKASQAERSDRHALNAWLSFNKKAWSDPVGDEFIGKFDTTLSGLIDTRTTQGSSDKSVRNIASTLRTLQKEAVKLLHDIEVPEGFLDAIRFGMARANINAYRVEKELGKLAASWVRGEYSPLHRKSSIDKSLALINKLEVMLGFPPDTLLSRAKGKGNKEIIVQLDADIPYRRYLKVVNKPDFEYTIAEDDYPSDLRTKIDLWICHKQLNEHMLPDGTVVSLDATAVWNSKATAIIARRHLNRYFGFLALPSNPSPVQQTNWTEMLKYGAGIPIADLRFMMLFDKNLLFRYMQYAENRAFNESYFLAWETQQREIKEGKRIEMDSISIKKTLPHSCPQFFIKILDLLNKPYSFLRMHPEFGQELDPPVQPENWENWCQTRYTELRSLYEAAEKKCEHGKRSNKKLLARLLRQDNPTLALHEIVERLLADMPPKTQPILQSSRYRDALLFQITIFDPLRIKNLYLLDIGKHVVKKDDGWYQNIPACEMKNYIHGYAQDRDRKFPEDIAAMLDQWITEYRPRIPGYEKTNALFIGRKGQRLSTTTLYKIFGRHSLTYLGVAIGPHSLRNIGATTAAKLGGSPTQIKALLNDSEEIAMTVYRDVQNRDEYEKLDDLYHQSKKKGGNA